MGGFKIDFGSRTERLDRRGVERKAGIRKNSTFSWKVHGWRLVMPFAEKGNREEEWLERKEPRHCTCEQSVRHTQVELSHGQVHEAQKRGQDWRLKTTWK